MDSRDLRDILDRVKAGSLSPDDAYAFIRHDAILDLGYAQLDMKRGLRQGISEVIYGQGKSAEQIAHIIEAMVKNGQRRIVATRVDAGKYQHIISILNHDCDTMPPLLQVAYNSDARIMLVGPKPDPDGLGTIVVVCAGTSDLPIAEEAALCAEMFGNKVCRIYDVGVAGLHRLFAHHEELMRASVVIAFAGMEGALPSVIGGLVAAPVIAVPTSVGYGASLKGIAALLSMLNSCASGVSVVNIDNGFGAAYQASLINHIQGEEVK